jgi:hypothetical protein
VPLSQNRSWGMRGETERGAVARQGREQVRHLLVPPDQAPHLRVLVPLLHPVVVVPLVALLHASSAQRHASEGPAQARGRGAPRQHSTSPSSSTALLSSASSSDPCRAFGAVNCSARGGGDGGGARRVSLFRQSAGGVCSHVFERTLAHPPGHKLERPSWFGRGRPRGPEPPQTPRGSRFGGREPRGEWAHQAVFLNLCRQDHGPATHRRDEGSFLRPVVWQETILVRPFRHLAPGLPGLGRHDGRLAAPRLRPWHADQPCSTTAPLSGDQAGTTEPAVGGVPMLHPAQASRPVSGAYHLKPGAGES